MQKTGSENLSFLYLCYRDRISDLIKMANAKQKKHIPEPTWDEICDWVGFKIADRGEKYFKDEAVEDVQVFDGGIIGTVMGSDEYTTVVRFENETPDRLGSECSCPYDWGDCKHAVALLLNAVALQRADHEFTVFRGESKPIYSARRTGLRAPSTLKLDTSSNDDSFVSIKTHLKAQSKNELISLLIDFAKNNDRVFRILLDQSDLTTSGASALVKSLQREMQNIMSKPAWWDGWKRRGHLPDFGIVRDGMRSLYASGDHDAVVELGEKLAKKRKIVYRNV